MNECTETNSCEKRRYSYACTRRSQLPITRPMHFTCHSVKFDSPAFTMRAYSEVWDHRYRILASVTSSCASELRTWYVSGRRHLPKSSLLPIAQSPVRITRLPIHQSLPTKSNTTSTSSKTKQKPHSQPPPCTVSPPPLLAPPAPPTPASSPRYSLSTNPSLTLPKRYPAFSVALPFHFHPHN